MWTKKEERNHKLYTLVKYDIYLNAYKHKNWKKYLLRTEDCILKVKLNIYSSIMCR